MFFFCSRQSYVECTVMYVLIKLFLMYVFHILCRIFRTNKTFYILSIWSVSPSFSKIRLKTKKYIIKTKAIIIHYSNIVIRASARHLPRLDSRQFCAVRIVSSCLYKSYSDNTLLLLSSSFRYKVVQTSKSIGSTIILLYYNTI